MQELYEELILILPFTSTNILTFRNTSDQPDSKAGGVC